MSVTGVLFSTGAIRQPEGALHILIKLIGASLTVAIIYVNVFAIVDAFAATVILLSVILGLVFLLVAPTPEIKSNRPGVIDILLSLMGFACGIYFYMTVDSIMTRITLFDVLTVEQIVAASIIVLLTIEATRRTVGLGLTLIVLAFMAYNLWGHLISGAFGHGYISYTHFLDITVFTTDGIFGVPVRVALTYAFLFVLFGTLLSKAGGSEFFLGIAAALTGRRPGGPAKVAVVSSALYGMISGSPTSDVVTTGSVTIPMMKKVGYTPRMAAAVEVTASTGGSLLPPVMGSAAFIMAEFTGIEYREIIVAALVPALLYYLGLYMQIHLMSRRSNMGGMDSSMIQPLAETLRSGGVFMVPLIVLTVMLLLGYGPTFVAVYGAASVLVVAMLSRRTRLSLLALFNILAETAQRMVPVVAACAAAGLVIGGLSMTGLSLKVSHLILLAAGNEPLVTLLLAAAVTILLGMGMPTPSAYILAAVLVAPAILDQGYSLMATHMFLLYFAVLSAMTPPVAVAAYAAAAISGGNPIGIAATAVRLGIIAFIIPFGFMHGQSLLLLGEPLRMALNIPSAVIGVIVLAGALEGFLRVPLDRPQRLAAAAIGFALIMPSISLLVTAATAGVLLALWIMIKRRRGGVPKTAPAPSMRPGTSPDATTRQ